MASDSMPLTTRDIIKNNRIILRYPEKSVIPTVSYGLIVYAMKTRKWVLVQRKHTAEFLVFIKGYYRLVHIPLLLSRCTKHEIKHIRAAVKNLDYFTDLYSKILCQPADGLSNAQLRFSEVLQLLPKLLSKLKNSESNLTWSWPKGRAIVGVQKEDCLTAAKREFEEEVEVTIPEAELISDTFITETYTTIGGKIITSHYWLYIVTDEFPIPDVDKHPEVKDRGWYSTTDSSVLLSPHLHRDALDLIALSTI